MDPVTGFFTCTQAAVYFARTIACLLDLCKCIKNSKTIASQYYSSIAQLYDIIIRISSSEYIPITDNLRDILVSIEETARVLKRRLIEGTRLKVTAILLTRQYSLGELLASLERQKSTLVLYLTTENTSATYELATCQSLGFQSMNYLRVGKKNKTSKRTLSDEHSGLMPDLRSSANRGIPRDPLINKEPMDSLVLVGEGSGTLIEDDKQVKLSKYEIKDITNGRAAYQRVRLPRTDVSCDAISIQGVHNEEHAYLAVDDTEHDPNTPTWQ